MYDFSYRRPTIENIEAVTAFLPFFKNGSDNEFYFFTDDDFYFTRKVWDFIHVLNTNGFVYGFDYGAWFSEIGQKYLERKVLMTATDIPTIQKLLTSIVRMNRFDMTVRGSIGIMKRMIDDGVILAVLIRLQQICQIMKQEHSR